MFLDNVFTDLKSAATARVPVIDAFDSFIIEEYSVRHYLDRAKAHGKSVIAADNIRFADEKMPRRLPTTSRIYEEICWRNHGRAGPIETLRRLTFRIRWCASPQ